jgi:hypothetical protein
VNTFIICNRGELVQIGLHVLKSNWRYTATFNIGAIDCIGRWGFSFIELSWHDFRCLEHFNLWTERSVWPSLGSVCILYTQQVTVTLVIRWQSPSCKTRWQGPWQVFQWFVLPPKFFAKVTVTFVGFASVMSTRCCTRHVKEDDRVFDIFVLPPNHFDKVAVTFFDNVIVLTPCCTGRSCLRISLLKWLTPCLTMWQSYCLAVGHGTERWRIIALLLGMAQRDDEFVSSPHHE